MTTTPTALSKSTISQTVWENIYDRLNDNVSSVTITGSSTITIQTFTNNFPEKSLDKKGDYPIVVINPIEMDWKRLTFRKKQVSGTFVIDVYTTQTESADKFIDAIINSIETYRDDLKGINMFNVNLESTDSDNATRGSFSVHLRTCTFSFNYIFTETKV